MKKKEIYKVFLIISIPYILSVIALSILHDLSLNSNLIYQEEDLLNYSSDSTELHADYSFTMPEEIDDFIEKGKEETNQKTEVAKPVEGSYQISLIVIGEDRKYAIINNVLLKEGDRINKYRVKKINPDSVILYRGIIKKKVMMEE